MNELDCLERIAIALEKIANVVDKFNETTVKTNPAYDIKDMLFKNVKPIKKEKSIHTEAWVLQPYNICITTLPPKYMTSIYHYYDKNGLCEDGLFRGPNTKIFYSKEDAIKYCASLGTEYEIIDIPVSDYIVIGDDYE